MINPSENIPVEGVDFNLLPDAVDDQAYVVRVNTGTFTGLLYRYFSVKVVEQDGDAILQYDLEVVDGIVPDEAKADFDQLTADILHGILLKAINEMPDSVSYKDENGQELGDGSSPTSD